MFSPWGSSGEVFIFLRFISHCAFQPKRVTAPPAAISPLGSFSCPTALCVWSLQDGNSHRVRTEQNILHLYTICNSVDWCTPSCLATWIFSILLWGSSDICYVWVKVHMNRCFLSRLSELIVSHQMVCAFNGAGCLNNTIPNSVSPEATQFVESINQRFKQIMFVDQCNLDENQTTFDE